MEDEAERPMTRHEQRFAMASGFEEVAGIVQGRCSMCHGRTTVWDGIGVAPRGLYLEMETDIARAAREIYMHARVTNAMPPANVTYMEREERRAIVKWYLSATRG